MCTPILPNLLGNPESAGAPVAPVETERFGAPQSRGWYQLRMAHANRENFCNKGGWSIPLAGGLTGLKMAEKIWRVFALIIAPAAAV